MPALPRGRKLSPAPARPAHADDWQILRVLSVYRLVLVGALAILYFTKVAPAVLGEASPVLFRSVIYVYVAAAAMFVFLLQRHWPEQHLQVYLQFATDTAALTLITYASGGVSSGMATLLITPTVAGSLILGTRISVLMAALASLSLFGEEFYRQFHRGWDPGEITQTGIIGGILMITALAGSLVSMRARASEARARAVGTELASMARLNESILELLQTGVVVVDSGGRVRSFNAAARRLLGAGTEPMNRPLASVCEPLARQQDSWLRSRSFEPTPFVHPGHGGELLPRFTQLGWGPDAPTLILLDDTAELRRQAQQMKLAALGRLSASIAHEIRNPLSAISQAGQLLGESRELDPQARKLVDMVQRHSRRIDRIVGDVLSLSRRESAMPQTLELAQWLPQCVATYQEGDPQRARRIELGPIPGAMRIRFDPGHLTQVLHNLLDNAYEHGRAKRPRVRVRVGTVAETGRHFLDVQDNGPGIDPTLHEQVFEPFFTTAHGGTGLGLFMARELCEYNQARLMLQTSSNAGACFRILFAAEVPEHR